MTTRTLALLTLLCATVLCVSVYRAAYGQPIEAWQLDRPGHSWNAAADQPIITKHTVPCDPPPTTPYCVHVNQPNGWKECYIALTGAAIVPADHMEQGTMLPCEEAERRLWVVP